MNDKQKKENKFGSRVKENRLVLDMKQQDFANQLGIGIAALSEIERDKNHPGSDFLQAMAENFGVNLHYLILGEGPMFIEDEDILAKFPEETAEDNFSDLDREFFYYLRHSEIMRLGMLSTHEKILLDIQDVITKELSLKKPGIDEPLGKAMLAPLVKFRSFLNWDKKALLINGRETGSTNFYR